MGVHGTFEGMLHRIFKKTPKIGRAYFYQSKEFAVIGRQLVIEEAHLLGRSNRKALELILQQIEEAFDNAQTAKHNETTLASRKFEAVEERLEKYVQEHFLHVIDLEQTRMRLKKAREEDKNSVIRHRKILDRLNHALRSNGGQRRKTEIHIFNSSLKDHNIFYYDLPSQMCLDAVLSRLVEDKTVRLDHNPHFYEKFPSTEDENIISLDLIMQLNTLGSTKNPYLILYILVDRESLIFFNCNVPHRVFGNVWNFDGKIIMKDVRGQLQDSSTIGIRITHSVQCWSRGRPIAEEHKWSSFLKCALENADLDILICPRLKPWEPSAKDGEWYKFTTTSSTLNQQSKESKETADQKSSRQQPSFWSPRFWFTRKTPALV